MELFAPIYYNKFKCIADKCRHSCCIDWEIDIDEKTLEKYKNSATDICKSIECADGEAYIRLCDDGRCPFLDGRGLCRIISEYGESMLSDICREHPRFYNCFENRVEAGLGLVCEEACRLVLDSDEPFSLINIGEASFAEACDVEYRDAVMHRAEIFRILDNADASLDEKLNTLEMSFFVSVDIHSLDEWLTVFWELEVLDEEWRRLLKDAAENTCVNDNRKYDVVFERFLKYLVYRHVSVATDFENLRARLGFCLLSVSVVRRIFNANSEKSKDKLFDIIRLFSSEIEYSEENTAELIFEFESAL